MPYDIGVPRNVYSWRKSLKLCMAWCCPCGKHPRGCVFQGGVLIVVQRVGLAMGPVLFTGEGRWFRIGLSCL